MVSVQGPAHPRVKLRTVPPSTRRPRNEGHPQRRQRITELQASSRPGSPAAVSSLPGPHSSELQSLLPSTTAGTTRLRPARSPAALGRRQRAGPPPWLQPLLIYIHNDIKKETGNVSIFEFMPLQAQVQIQLQFKFFSVDRYEKSREDGISEVL